MISLANIQKPVNKELQEFEKSFRDSMKSKVALLDIITSYIIRNKGKQLRPLFVFLAARSLNEVKPATYVAASLIELLHTATLIHDDVVDESFERRGFFSINALWRGKIAVLVGDYLLSRGLLLALDHKEYDLLHTVSDAVREMSEGEIMQIRKTRDLLTDPDEYYEIITKKTASLFGACMASGAQSVAADKKIIEDYKQAGIFAGIAFQIKDDLLDYEKSSIIGKPKGNDIKEKKITLPLIYGLMKASEKDRKHIISLIKNANRKKHKIGEIIDFAHNSGGIDFARQEMSRYKHLSLDILLKYPQNEAMISLLTLIDYVINRDK